MTTFFGMAVLVVRILFVLLSYQVLEKFNWAFFFTKKDQASAKILCGLLSIGLGHLVSSFFIEIIETLRQMVMSQFL